MAMGQDELAKMDVIGQACLRMRACESAAVGAKRGCCAGRGSIRCDHLKWSKAPHETASACLLAAPQHVQTIMRLERALRVYEEEKEIEQAPPLIAASVPMHRRLRAHHPVCSACTCTQIREAMRMAAVAHRCCRHASKASSLGMTCRRTH